MEMSNKFKIKIISEVEVEVELGSLETLSDLRLRNVDIYLHGPSPDGWHEKVDLGCDKSTILIKDLNEY